MQGSGKAIRSVFHEYAHHGSTLDWDPKNTPEVVVPGRVLFALASSTLVGLVVAGAAVEGEGAAVEVAGAAVEAAGTAMAGAAARRQESVST